MNDPKQIQLGLPLVGEGDKSVKATPRKSADLLARGHECIRLARSNKVQYALYVERLPELKQALANVGKDKYIKIGYEDFMPTGIARLIVRFVENYPSIQCSLVEEMKEIRAILKKRKIGFVFSDEIYPDGGC